MDKIWDERDIELGLRERMATVIAQVVSGLPGAVPSSDDYGMADEFRRRIEEHLESM